MKLKRILSGLILLAIISSILILGNTMVVNIAISVVALIAINEYFNSLKNKHDMEKWIGNILAVSLAFINILPREIKLLIFPIAIVLLFLKVIITRHEN